MAKKAKKKSATAKPKQQQKKAVKHVAAQIGEQDFLNLVRRCKSAKKQASEINGGIGELIKSAVENKNLDRTAFSIFRRLDSMSDEKLATTLACLDFYIDIGGLEDRIENAPALPIARQEAGEKEEGDASQKPDGKVVPMKAAE